MLEGKAIIVTGGSSGIGRAAVKIFTDAGAMVLVADRSAEAGLAVVEEISRGGGVAVFQHTDVSDEDSVREMVDAAVAAFGQLDGAFNNAGIEQKLTPFPALSMADYDQVMDINLRGVFMCMKYEIQAMRGSGGAIVNTSSTGGQMAIPNAAEYIAAKHGVAGLTRAASTEAKETGVRVNAVMPALTQTPMIERISTAGQWIGAAEAESIANRHSIGRFGQPEDVARAAKWLLSEESAFINGVLLPVDGGFTAR